MTSTRRTEVSAVLSDDFYALLDALGIRAAFDDGQCKCDFCHDSLSPSNVLLVFPKSGRRVGFLCSKPTCMEDYQNAAPTALSSDKGQPH